MQIEVTIGDFYTKVFKFMEWPSVEQAFAFDSEWTMIEG